MIASILKKLFWFILFLCSVYADQDRFIIERIQTEQGLSSNLISCLLQDHFGFLWIGTDNGLYRIIVANQLAEWPANKEEPVTRPKTKLKTRR